MKAQPEAKPEQITRKGITVTLRPLKRGQNTNWRVEYTAGGKRKQIWRATFEKAKKAADAAIEAVLDGDHAALELRDGDLHTWVRANEHLAPHGIKLDIAARDIAEILTLLGGRATPLEVVRDWLKRNAVARPKITIEKAREELIARATADKKSTRRVTQLDAILTVFAKDMNTEVANITPDLVSKWLANLALTERTKRNYRDVVGFFCRWLIVAGYLAKDADWLDGVQQYSNRKLGEITTYTPEEIKKLLTGCDARLVPFIAIGAFAGLRHAEVARLDWSEIEFCDVAEKVGEIEFWGWIEVKAENAKNENDRRLVPMHRNLRDWLLPLRKDSGPVCEFANTTKQLLARAKAAGIAWKHNALRHTAISCRLAECADAPRVADEVGNSPAMIRKHYLRRVKPKQAAEWFAVTPPKQAVATEERPDNVITLKQEAA
jgi:integrase